VEQSALRERWVARLRLAEHPQRLRGPVPRRPVAQARRTLLIEGDLVRCLVQSRSEDGRADRELRAVVEARRGAAVNALRLVVAFAFCRRPRPAQNDEIAEALHGQRSPPSGLSHDGVDVGHPRIVDDDVDTVLGSRRAANYQSRHDNEASAGRIDERV
jgi:hypothetical protein